MEDDAEILDWGHEEEAGIASNSEQRSFMAEDAEDAVSLGGDEEDEFLSYRSRVPQDITRRGQTPPRGGQQTVKQDGTNIETDAQRSRRSHPSERAESGTPSKEQNKTSAPEQSPMLGRTHSFGMLTHALPPKPVVSSVPFVHPSHPSIIEATAMGSRADRDKRNGASKTIIHDSDPLPPGWEIRHPRSGRGIYYYNVRTEESTWTRPTSSSTREKRDQRLDARDDLVDRGFPGRSDETLISRVGRLDGDGLSYDDRHYRPGENGRHDDRATTHTYIITGDSYVPDLDNRQNGRSSPPLSRFRDNVREASSRRPASPDGSYGDPFREAPAASTLSVEDRTWVARDVTLEQRPGNHRQHDTDPAPESRNPPRDSDRSSTLRPRSPTYARDFQEALHIHSKPAQPISQAASSRQQSQLSRDRRHSDTYNGMRQARVDETSSTRPSRSQWADEYDIRESRRSPILRTGPISDMEADTSKSLASDAQRPSRRRTPLPPQSAIFREGSRHPAPATTSRDSGFSVPLSPREHERLPRGSHRQASDLPRVLARRSLSPPPLRDADPIDHARRAPGRVRPLSMRDSYVPHDSSTLRTGDRDVLHIDDTPSRISDTSRHPATRPLPDERAEHVPRHPRAMMETSGGVPRGPAAAERSPRPNRMVPRESVPNANLPPQSGRDRQWVERPTPVEPSFTKRESTRPVGEVRALPTAPNVRLSGTNSTPIGNRSRFAGSVAPPAPLSGVGHRSTIISGSNAEPVGGRTTRPAKDYEHPSRPEYVDVPPSAPNTGIRDDIRVRSPASVRRPLPPPEAGLPSRPSRPTGTSRFGPPIVKEVEPRRNTSPESLHSGAYFPEDGSRATPPPLSRESSSVSMRDAVAISRHPGQPNRRPSSPSANRESVHHMSVQHRVGDEDPTRQRDRVYSPINHPRPLPAQSRSANYHSNTEVGVPRQRQNTPPLPLTQRRRTYVPERLQEDLDARGGQQPEPMVQDDARPDTRVPSIHPDRARMFQNGLPPRPSTDLGRSRSGRGQHREKNENENVSLGPGDRRFEPRLPDEQRRPEADVRPPTNRGGSLLDRLTMEGDGPSKPPSSLRDRVQLPSKRDREEMQSSDLAMEQDGDDHDGTKRARRRGAKSRKGRRGP